MASCINSDEAAAIAGQRIAQAVGVCELILRLPAVPTLDWCELAAACFLGLVGSGAAAVVIVIIAKGGVVELVHAAGAACGHANASVPGFDKISLRCGVEKLAGERWCPHPDCTAMAQTELLSRDDRVGTAHAPTWDWLRDAPLLAGIAPLNVPGAFIMVLLGSYPVPFEQKDKATLCALLGPLSRAALRAVGQGSLRANDWLSLREQEVLNDLLLGKTVKEIAEAMGRSPHTIHDHVKSLHRKLQASTRGELIARALGYATPSVQPHPSAG